MGGVSHLPRGGLFAFMFENLHKVQLEISRIAEQQGKEFFYFGNFIPNPCSQVMFVAEMPTVPRDKKKYDSHTNFQVSKSDLMFVNILGRYGFGGSYLTDIVKTADIARRPNKDEVNTWLPILLQEIEAIAPKVLVAIGDSAYTTLLKLEIGLPIVKITHPAHVFSYHGISVEEYDAEIKKLSDLIVFQVIKP